VLHSQNDSVATRLVRLLLMIPGNGSTGQATTLRYLPTRPEEVKLGKKAIKCSLCALPFPQF
jgi:hypothetical protein